jgi:4-alpha-glucanotransferase
MIPLEKLATEEYGFMLSEEELQATYDKVAKMKNTNKVNYPFVYEEFTALLQKAYQNFVERGSATLKAEFSQYRAENIEELEPNAVYEILVVKNKNEDWKQWKSDVDRNLYNSDKYKTQREELIEENKETIDLHIFKQWLLER